MSTGPMKVLWRRDCACGAVVIADPDEPRAGVAYHNAQEPHRTWSRRTSWAPPPEEDPTAEAIRVDLSAVIPVRPVLLRRPQIHERRFVPGRTL